MMATGVQKHENVRDIMGVIEDTLPLALYSVRLVNGRSVRASASVATCHATTRLIPGDRVLVRLSGENDPTRGQIGKF